MITIVRREKNIAELFRQSGVPYQKLNKNEKKSDQIQMQTHLISVQIELITCFLRSAKPFLFCYILVSSD